MLNTNIRLWYKLNKLQNKTKKSGFFIIVLNPSVNITKLDIISKAPSIYSLELVDSHNVNNLIKFFSRIGVNLMTL